MIDLFGWRARLVETLTGDILEIGVGSGPNLAHYRMAQSVTGIEPDAASAERARRAAKKASVPVTIDIAPAEKLPYDDDSFDHIVSSLVLCSVADQHTALNELRRVLRPGGELHGVEHIQPKNIVGAEIARLLTPKWRKISCNCHLDRQTLAILVESGWDVDVEKQVLNFVRFRATASPEPRYSAKTTASNQEFYEKAIGEDSAPDG